MRMEICLQKFWMLHNMFKIFIPANANKYPWATYSLPAVSHSGKSLVTRQAHFLFYIEMGKEYKHR